MIFEENSMRYREKTSRKNGPQTPSLKKEIPNYETTWNTVLTDMSPQCRGRIEYLRRPKADLQKCLTLLLESKNISKKVK